MSNQEQNLRAEGRRAIEAADARTAAAAATLERQRRELEKRVQELKTLASKEGERASSQARLVESSGTVPRKQRHRLKLEWDLTDKLEAKEREIGSLLRRKRPKEQQTGVAGRVRGQDG